MRSLTRGGWALSIGALVLITGGRLLGLPEFYLLGTTAILAVAFALVLVHRPPSTIDAERRVRPRRVHLGDQCRVELRVTNAGGRRTPLLTLVDPVEGTSGALMLLAPLAPGELRSAGYRLPTERRGLVQVGPLEAIRTDPLGLASRRHRVSDITEVTVLPVVEPMGGRVPGGGHDDPMAGAAHPVAGRSGDEEFATLRSYVVGDDLRRIHWPTSARTGELLVRQDDPPWQGHVTILLDARSDRIGPEAFEVAVSAAASILNDVAIRGDRTRLIVTDGTDTGPTDARSARDLLFEHLALVQRHDGLTLPDPPTADGRSNTGELMLITGQVDQEEIARLAGLRHRYARTQVVLVAGPGTGSGSDTGRFHGTGGGETVGGLDLVVLVPGRPFATAWATAGRTVRSAS